MSVRGAKQFNGQIPRGANPAQIQAKRPAKAAEDVLLPEQEAFQRLRPALLRRYGDEYVAIHGGRLADHDKDDEALAARMFTKVGDAPFYIARLETTPSIFEVPSPELAG